MIVIYAEKASLAKAIAVEHQVGNRISYAAHSYPFSHFYKRKKPRTK